MPTLILNATKTVNRSVTVSAVATPMSATFPDRTQPVEKSKCWETAKIRFRERLSTSDPRASEENIYRFLKNNDRIEKAILECEKLQSKANNQYGSDSASRSSRMVGELLNILGVVKRVGDP